MKFQVRDLVVLKRTARLGEIRDIRDDVMRGFTGPSGIMCFIEWHNYVKGRPYWDWISVEDLEHPTPDQLTLCLLSSFCSDK